MTQEMQNALERELNDAKSIEDPARLHEAIETVQSHMLVALIDCQRKTAERVKELVANKEETKNKIEGAKWLWTVIRYLVAAGAGGAVLKFASGGSM